MTADGVCNQQPAEALPAWLIDCPARIHLSLPQGGMHLSGIHVSQERQGWAAGRELLQNLLQKVHVRYVEHWQLLL